MSEEQSITNENISTPAIENTQQKNMEVHHPHGPLEKKKFMEYFWEFLMLFLAVTLGFFAENLREYQSERGKEKEYITSFIKNLIQDTTDLNNEIASDNNLINGLDDLVKIFPYYKDGGENLRTFCQQCVSYVPHNTVFNSNDGTMVQLKNAGGFRLIIKDFVADSIVAYDNITKLTQLGGEYCREQYNKTYDTWSHVFDLSYIMDTSYYADGSFTNNYIPSSIIVGSDNEMKYFYNSVLQYEGTLSNYISYNLQGQLDFAKRLIPYLRKEYGIEESADEKAKQ